MLALAGKCSVGDQLHPNGKIDQATYELIGSVYREVEKKEPWCQGARAVTEIAVMSPEEFQAGVRLPEASMGVIRMLQEGRHQFDIVDSQTDLAGYKVVILPDVIPVSADLAARLDAFLGRGGALIASYKSGLNGAGDAFALESLGVDYVGDAPYSPDFIVPSGPSGKACPRPSW
jgi:beta-galactosidase GanA